MIVLPLFWDQVDNAQRVHETGFGRRLATYGFARRGAAGAIDELLADAALRERLAAVAARMQATRGTVRAADLIERLATTHAPVLREEPRRRPAPRCRARVPTHRLARPPGEPAVDGTPRRDRRRRAVPHRVPPPP